MPRHVRVQAGQGVVQSEAGAEVGVIPEPVLERQQERRRVDEVRREALREQAPLVQRLAHEPEVEALQVAQAAVDELAGAAGRAGGEVALLDERDGEATAGGVERDAAARDAAADDEHVEDLGGQPLELAAAGVPRRPAGRPGSLGGLVVIGLLLVRSWYVPAVWYVP